MRDPQWAIPGAIQYLAKPTATQADARHRAASGSTPEEWAAQRRQELSTLRVRHDRMLERTRSPILKALIEEHGPTGDSSWPVCVGCPEVREEDDSEPPSWPCSAWSFISDRMKEDT